MSDWVFPVLPGMMVTDLEPLYKTLVFPSAGEVEQRVSLLSDARRRFRVRFPFLRDTVAAPAPWSPYSEIGIVQWFHDQHKGAFDSFLFDHPRARKNLLAYSQDFSQSAWTAFYGKPAITAGIAAPDGTLTAQQFASLDSGPANESGIVQAVGAAVPGPVVASAWARCVSGTLGISLGVNQAEKQDFTLTTSWQRFAATAAGGIILESSVYRALVLFESTLTNQAWQVWGAQSEPAPSAGLYVPTGATAATGRYRVRFEEDSLQIRQLADKVYEVDLELVTTGT